jgi:hypothetical protein
MRGDEIDAGPGARPSRLKMSPEAHRRGANFAGRRLALPEVAHRVAVACRSIPPSRAEIRRPGSRRAAVPGLGDQLHVRSTGILAAGLEEAALVVEAVRLARQDGAEIEAEAVDVQFAHPVAQAVGDHLDHARMRQIDVLPVPVSLM